VDSFIVTGNTLTDLQGILRGELSFLYVEDVHTSLENIWAPRPFTKIDLILYIAVVHISPETNMGHHELLLGYL
jgi:hypothetical protein